MAAPTVDTFLFSTGKSTHVLKPGEVTRFKAKAGEHYRVLKRAGAEDKLPDNVLVKKSGEDLRLEFPDGTQLTLENYYTECRSGGCDVTVPGANGAQITLGADAGTPGAPSAGVTAGTALGDGSTLVYAYGSQEVLMSMARGDSAL